MDYTFFQDFQRQLKQLREQIDWKHQQHRFEKYILDLVCDTYKVSYRALVYSKSNPSVTRARQVAYCLLHYTLGLSVRHIAKRVFHFDHHNSVGSAINMYKKLNPKLAPDKEFKESIDMLREKVMTKIQESEK